MHSTVILAVALFVCGASARIIHTNENSISSESENAVRKEWVKITKFPPGHSSYTIGVEKELVCEATGTPPPVVEWIVNDASYIVDYETKRLLSNPTAIARVSATLIVNRWIGPEKTFTCIAQSGGKVAVTRTTLMPTTDMIPQNMSYLLKMFGRTITEPVRARIIQHYPAIFEPIGSTVELPCKTFGQPQPIVVWTDSDNLPIDEKNDRLTVTSTGNLVIKDLRWSDMGDFKCSIDNGIDEDSKTTFVYPLKKKDD